MNYNETNKAKVSLVFLFFEAQRSAGCMEIYLKYRHNQLETDLLTYEEMSALCAIVQPKKFQIYRS